MHAWLRFALVADYVHIETVQLETHSRLYRHADPRQLSHILTVTLTSCPFDFRVSACLQPAVDYISTDIGVEGSSRRSPLLSRKTDRQKDKQSCGGN